MGLLLKDMTILCAIHILESVDEEERKTGQVSAHRLLLAGVSPVFRKQFFGPMKNTENVVDIKETTIEAFTTMIKYIYMPPVPDSKSVLDGSLR